MGSEIKALHNSQTAAQASPDTRFTIPAGMTHVSFQAMGTTITLLLPKKQQSEGAALARNLFEEWEQTLSRFRLESELSKVNRQAGTQVTISELLLDVLIQALAAARVTDGIYDPTLLNQLCQLGYDRSFDKLPSTLPDIPYHGQPGGAWRHIQIDQINKKIILPANIQLDFGGIAKGMAVDAVLEQLHQSDIHSALVNAGGDLAVRGLPPKQDYWNIAIPGKDIAWTIPLTHGAIATSGLAKRHWQQGKTFRHHLIDPRTGFPVYNSLWSVTVIAADCVQAEIAAKTAFILGASQGKIFIEKHQMAALFINTDGTWELGGRWPEHLMRRLS
jgi:thiamine biosynthesis lipoprotein